MLSGVERHLPRQMVAPAWSTTHTDVCSSETSSPTYCCCGFMVVLRFVTTEALMLLAPASAITGCPDRQSTEQDDGGGVKERRRRPAAPARSVLDAPPTSCHPAPARHLDIGCLMFSRR